MNKEKYTLQEVTTPALEREWLDFPKRIYKGNRNWVCPLDVDVLEVFNPSKNELFADGEAIRWVARDARGELVGRIAAFYNREKASIEEQPTGGCGFFESIDDQQVADMLFEASRMWLASRGMEAMDGDQLRTAARLVGAAGRGLRIPAPLQESLQSALLQGVVRKLRF